MAITPSSLVFALSMTLGLFALAPPPAAAAGIDEPASTPNGADKESRSADKPKKQSAKDRSESAEKLKSLREERDRVMEELVALEEGYSKLAEEDTDSPAAESPEALEARLQSRLTLLQTRLDTLDLEIAAMVRAKSQR